MKEERLRLLRRILEQLELEEIPSSMVSRRMTVFKAFDANEERFYDPDFVEMFGKITNKGKSFDASALTAASVFTYINDHQELWGEAFEKDKDEEVLIQRVIPLEIPEKYKAILDRNQFQPTQPEITHFWDNLLRRIKITKAIPYPDFEREILYLLEGKTNLEDSVLLEEAAKAYAYAVYKEDATNSYRLLFEEIKQYSKDYEKLGLSFYYPELRTGLGNISRAMDSAYIASTFAGGVFELKRIISVANKIGQVSYSENEVKNFFSSYLDGGIDSLLVNPPSGFSYFRSIDRTIDYDFKTDLANLFPEIECRPIELTSLINQFLNILVRVKIVEWTRNVPIGGEKTILDLIHEVQEEVLGLTESEEIYTLKEMFKNSTQNVIEATVGFYANKLAYSYLLRTARGGIEKELMEAFKNLGSAPKGIGNQTVTIADYYRASFPETWQKEFYYDFILGTASKGLSSASKGYVRERVILLVEDDPRSQRKSLGTKKIAPEQIFDALRKEVRVQVRPTFDSAEKAQSYLDDAFRSVKVGLNKAWLKKILRSGFELYIEHPVTQAWTNEMEDLSRELIRYNQDLSVLNRPSSEINELVVESLGDSFKAFDHLKDFRTDFRFNETTKDQEVLSLFLKLPETPTITDSQSVVTYLSNAFHYSKSIINTILERKVEEEVERKTFDQEMAERISWENITLDWFIKGCTFYEQIISESVSLEKTTDPNEVLLKTVYGGIFYLIEESMEGLHLEEQEKISKAFFLRDLFQNQVFELRKTFSKLNLEYNFQTIIHYILDQISLWDSVFRLKDVIFNLEGDNRLKKALYIGDRTESLLQTVIEDSRVIMRQPGVRGLVGRELIPQWVRKWVNTVINVAESFLELSQNNNYQDMQNLEQDLFELLFTGTGRNDIRNFYVPCIVGNVKQVLGFETVIIPPEFLNYTYDVFSEAVQCDSQLAISFVARNWPGIDFESFLLNEKGLSGRIDLVAYLGTRIESCRSILGVRELSLSDVVKKATGLSLSGLKLETLVYQIGNRDLFLASSYTENAFEGSEVTGLTLELISKENIPIGNINSLCKSASHVLAGLMERNPVNVTKPDALVKVVVQQMLEEAKLVLLRDSGTLQERIQIEPSSTTLPERNISRSTIRITSAYEIKLKRYSNNSDGRIHILPEEVKFFGEKLENFGLFTQLIVPFFQPGQIIKERLLSDQQLMNDLDITRSDDFQRELIFPSLVVFDDNGRYKVVFGVYTSLKELKIVIAEEDETSKMGVRTIQYLLKTRTSFEEFTAEIGLLPLPELNRSFPLNNVLVLKEKEGRTTLDFELIKNISLGAI